MCLNYSQKGSHEGRVAMVEPGNENIILLAAMVHIIYSHEKMHAELSNLLMLS